MAQMTLRRAISALDVRWQNVKCSGTSQKSEDYKVSAGLPLEHFSRTYLKRVNATLGKTGAHAVANAIELLEHGYLVLLPRRVPHLPLQHLVQHQGVHCH